MLQARLNHSTARLHSLPLWCMPGMEDLGKIIALDKNCALKCPKSATCALTAASWWIVSWTRSPSAHCWVYPIFSGAAQGVSYTAG